MRIFIFILPEPNFKFTRSPLASNRMFYFLVTFLPLHIFLDLDPCLDVMCDYHCLCKAFGPSDARCVSVKNCPSFQEPICSSNGTTYDNKCLFEQEMCLLQLNFTVQHPGSCEGMIT